MARVTGDATAPHVGAIALVCVVNPGPGVTATVRAREQRVGRGGTRMACRANAARVAVIDIPPRVRKRRAQPIRRGVAGCACGCSDSGCGRVGSEVIRHRPAHCRSALPLGGVATVAVGRGHGGTGVAKVAGHRDVRAGQRETGCVVVKDRAKPGSRGVARCAGGWISGSDVIRYRPAEGRGALPLCDVAAVAIRGQSAAVVPINVAQRAGHGCVRAGQREGGRVVIESGGRPIRRRVADGTIRRESSRDVIRHRPAQCGGALPCSQMAAVAGGRIQREIVAHVAGRAGSWRGRNVHARQSPTCRGVVKRCSGKSHGRVAVAAVRHGK